MQRILIATCALLLCTGASWSQITTLPAANLVNPLVLDFDTGAPAPGPVSPTDPYFLGFGLSQVSIVNAPGMHTAGTDTLSSGFVGNALCSVNNTLAIVAPNGAMDDHTAGAGWSFQIIGGTHATQFGCLVVDQVNHQMAVETWANGVMRNTYTFTMSGNFPNPPVYFEDPCGFDEVRFMNVATTGGWGIDDFTIANLQPGPVPLGQYQQNSASCSHDFNGALGSCMAPAQLAVNAGTSVTSTLNGTGQGYEYVISIGSAVPRALQTPPLVLPTQTLNIDYTALALFWNGAAAGTPLLPAAAPFLGSVAFTFAAPPVAAPTTLCWQAIVIDAAAPYGLWLSQPTEITFN